MSLAVTLVFVVGFISLARPANRPDPRSPSLAPGARKIRSGGAPRAEVPIAVLFAVSILIWLLIASEPAAHHFATLRSTSSEVAGIGQAVSLTAKTKQLLKSELADAAVLADVNTLQTYRKELVDRLANTNVALSSHPSDATLLKRKQLLEVALTNAGGTGIQDRLSDFEAATRIVNLGLVSTDVDAAGVRRAVANLRNTTASWKAGPFGNLATTLGLHWDNERGLVIQTAYVWGRNGWQPGTMLQKAGEQGTEHRLPAD